MHTPKVSVIIPVYNVERYLRACLDSIVSQTINDLEIVIVDDASTDGSLSLVREYEKAYGFITTIALSENTPGGSGIPSNMGIRRARGEYIGFVDSDDWADKSMFEELYCHAMATDADLVLCNFKLYYENENRFYDSYDNERWRFLADRIGSDTFKLITHKDIVQLSSGPWRKLYKRAFLMQNNIRFPEGNF